MTSDFVYKQVLSGCLQAGCSQNVSRNAAQVASDRYKKGRYNGKVSQFILQCIKDSKKAKS